MQIFVVFFLYPGSLKGCSDGFEGYFYQCGEMFRFVAFLRMNRGEVKLVHFAVVVRSVAAFGLRTTDDPKSPRFSLFEGI